MKKDYDVVVIGAGSGGLTAATGFAKIGRKTLLVEQEHMGGECTNSGCIPSKALLHHAKSFHSALTISGKNKKNEAYRTNAFVYVRSKVEGILEHETPEAFRAQGIDVEFGEAEFVAPCTIKIEESEFGYKHAVIATGSSPRMINVPGISQNDILTNQNIFDLETVPERLLIVGAGPIGMEMGQAFAMLGSNVTIADVNDRFARLEDEAVSPIIQKVFTNLGITIHLNAFIKEVENKQALFEIKENGNESTLTEVRVAYDKILYAVGRLPNFPKGLDTAGIAADTYGIQVDKQHRTSNKHVYAVGDIAQRLKFTHTANDSARQVVTHVVSKGFLRADNKKAVPKVTYTEPEIAQVGMSYQDALQKYTEKEVMRIEVPFLENDRAQTDSDTDGLLVVYAKRLNGAVLGANIIGPSAGELISIFTLALDKKISMWSLRNIMYAYPTYSLVVKKAGDHFFAQQISNLKSDILYLLKKHTPKILVGALWLMGLLQLYIYKTAHGMGTTETALMIFDFITMTIWGPLLYVLVYALRPLTFFPATALTILSGIFFGFWGGTVLTILAATLSSGVAYAVGRFFGKGLSPEDSIIGNWVTSLQKNTFISILTMRLIFLPFDGVSYIAGILKTAFVPFIAATFVGILLGTATFVSIGASLDIESFKMDGISFNTLDPKYLGLSVVIFVASLVLSKFLKKWQAV